MNQSDKKLETLEKNGISVDRGMICLGSKFSFDFTQTQRLNGWYQNNIERLERKLKEDTNDVAQIIYNQIKWGNDKDQVLKFIKRLWKVDDMPPPQGSRC